MKKIIAIVIALMVMCSMMVPAYAAGGTYVPSIEEKDAPEIVATVDAVGNAVYGRILENDNVIGHLGEECIILTPIAHVWDEDEEVAIEIEDDLLYVYEGIRDDFFAIPYEEIDKDIDPEDYVVRDLVDARWACEDHPVMVEPKGVVVELIFDLGVAADAELVAAVFDAELIDENVTDEDKAEYYKDAWEPAVELVNNGDGTVTVTLEKLGVIAFSIKVD